MVKIKNKLMAMYDIVYDACIENSDGNAKARTTLLLTGYISNIISSITGGIFFTAFMLALGASEVYIGYITMATSICTLIQFLSPLLWERIPRRKPAIVAWSFVSNLLTYLGITMIPFLNAENDTKLILYVIITIFTTLVGSLFSSANTAWTLPSLPIEKRINHSSLANIGNTILNIATVFLASIYLDHMESSEILSDKISNTLIAVVILRLISLVIAIASTTLSALNIKEYPYEKSNSKKSSNGLIMLLSPLKNKLFMMIIIPALLETFCNGIYGNFFNIHLVQNVDLSYTAISAIRFVSIPTKLLMTVIWTVILRKRSWLKCLAVGFAGNAITWIFMMLISSESVYFYFIAAVFGTFFDPCMALVGGNLVYMKLPNENRTAYLGFYSIMTQICSIIGQWVGTMFVQFTPNLRLTLFGIEICNLQMTIGIAACLSVGIIIYSLYLSSKPEFSQRV